MGCYKKSGLNIISIIISIVLAFIVFSVFSESIFTEIPTLLFTAIGITGFFLVALFVTIFASRRREDYCLCEFAPLLLVGILGTIALATIILAITVGATALGILVSIFSFFFVLAIIQFFLFVLCLIKIECYKCNDKCRENNY